MLFSSFIPFAFGCNRIRIVVVLLSQKEKDSNHYNRGGGNFGGEKIREKIFRILNEHEQSAYVTEPTWGIKTKPLEISYG